MIAAASRTQYEAEAREAQRIAGIEHGRGQLPRPGQESYSPDASEEVSPPPPVETAARAAEAFGLEKGIVCEVRS